MKDLIRKAIGGDIDAFTDIVTKQEQVLYRVARTRLTDAYDISDAVQNTLTAAFVNVRKVKKPDYFMSWLIRILINECNAIYRSRQKEVVSAEGGNIEPAAQQEDIYFTADSNADFVAALEALNFEERQAITLCYSADLSTRQIAELTNTNENTVKSRIRRSKEKLRLLVYKEKNYDD